MAGIVSLPNDGQAQAAVHVLLANLAELKFVKAAQAVTLLAGAK
jgi:hypothetical protein